MNANTIFDKDDGHPCHYLSKPHWLAPIIRDWYIVVILFFNKDSPVFLFLCALSFLRYSWLWNMSNVDKSSSSFFSLYSLSCLGFGSVHKKRVLTTSFLRFDQKKKGKKEPLSSGVTLESCGALNEKLPLVFFTRVSEALGPNCPESHYCRILLVRKQASNPIDHPSAYSLLVNFK